MTAYGYFDETGTWWPNGSLVGLDAEGKALESKKSTLGVAVPLESVGPQVLLDMRVNTVYILDPAEADEALVDALNGGALFSAPFRYRGGYDTQDAILVGNDEGLFVVVGKPAEPVWVELAQPPADVFDDEEDEGDDDLDFEMF